MRLLLVGLVSPFIGRRAGGKAYMVVGMTDANTAKVVLEPGDTAPEFTLLDQHGKEVSLASYRGQKVFVYFYPAAATPGCTKEACDFRDALEAPLKPTDMAVVGISPDNPEKLAKFDENNQLGFPLLSDPEKEVARAWGAFGEKKNYGRVFEGIIRSTFLVDEEGKIELALYNVRATGHVERVLKQMGLAQ